MAGQARLAGKSILLAAPPIEAGQFTDYILDIQRRASNLCSGAIADGYAFVSYVTCGRSIFEMQDGVSVPVDPMNCAVGCSTCGNICPTAAIFFLNLDAVWKLERERQIFRTVKKEALKRHEREDTLKARHAAQQPVADLSTCAKVEVAGKFGDKQFLLRLETLIEGRPFDIVRLQLNVPTVKGARQKAPSYMSFEVTSEQQEDIGPFLAEVRIVVHDAGLVLVGEQRL